MGYVINIKNRNAALGLIKLRQVLQGVALDKILNSNSKAYKNSYDRHVTNSKNRLKGKNMRGDRLTGPKWTTDSAEKVDIILAQLTIRQVIQAFSATASRSTREGNTSRSLDMGVLQHIHKRYSREMIDEVQSGRVDMQDPAFVEEIEIFKLTNPYYIALCNM